MRYYLIPTEEDDLDVIDESMCIGELAFKKFYVKDAWRTVMELIDNSSLSNNLLEYYEVKSQNGSTISWDDFLDMLMDMQVMVN